MRILLAGASGQVGYAVAQGLPRQGLELIALARAVLDISQPESIDAAIEAHQPDLIINAAAYTAVDQAEQESTQAYATNRDGPLRLAMACAERDIPLIHLSTDYVFDGTATGAYRETDSASPVGVYARSKAEGDAAIMAGLTKHLILRVSWVYGLHGHNFVKTMVRLAGERRVVRVVDDQWGCPTSATRIAEVLAVLCQRYAAAPVTMPWGVYHFAGQPPTSWYQFAESIIEQARRHTSLLIEELLPIATADYPTAAKRPANTVLNCAKITEVFGVSRADWRQDLTEMLDLYYRSPQ